MFNSILNLGFSKWTPFCKLQRSRQDTAPGGRNKTGKRLWKTFPRPPAAARERKGMASFDSPHGCGDSLLLKICKLVAYSNGQTPVGINPCYYVLIS